MVIDELGTSIEVPDEPARIISLVPNLSELLWYVGAADRVVGVTEYCVAPPHGFPRAERVRGTKNPDVSRIVELQPDVVIANSEENRRIDVERLREADVAVYVTNPRSLPEATGSIEAVAAVVGAGGRGRGVADAIRRAQDAVGSSPPARPVRAVCAIWRDPWMVVGPGTVAGDLLVRAGFTLVAPGPRYPEVTLEDVADDAPDVVLLPDEPYAFGEDDRTAFDHLSARTRLIDGTSLTWYGPRTAYALRELNRLARSLTRTR